MNASRTPDHALTLIGMEYMEMPDLKLTAGQARRLCALPLEECQSALAVLETSGFLARSRDGAFLRRSGATPAG